MKRIVNGEFVTVDEAPELPHGGDGVFETVLWRDDSLMLWRPHWARFKAGCTAFGVQPPVDSSDIAAHACELAAENGISYGIARFVAWRPPPRATDDAKSGPKARGSSATSWALDLLPPRPHMAKPELAVTFGPNLPPATPDRAFKHLRRSAWLDSLRAARAAGFDEALLCDPAGYLVEGCVSNVFFVRDGILHTPDLALGALPGVMRAEVIALVRAAGWELREGQWTAADVAQATEVWLTNSLIGVRPVARIDQRELAKERPVLERLRELWEEKHGWGQT